MKIKDRLALYFTLISTITLLGVILVVYFSFLQLMESEFYNRLIDRTRVTATLYLEADEISSEALNKARTQYLEGLNGEVIRIYNELNNASFIGDDQQYWTYETINTVRKQGRIQYKEGERQVVGIYYKDNQGDFVILASAIDNGTVLMVQKLTKVMAILFVVIFLGLLLSARWIAKRILSPLNLLMEQVKLIKVNKLHFRVEVGKNKDEINMLAQNFNNLMEHLEHAFVLQETFVANASHELRTPLTRIIIGSEISLSKDRTKEEYKVALQSMLDDAEKLDTIITALFNLAGTDLQYGSAQVELLRIDEMLWDLQSIWSQKEAPGKLLIEMNDLPLDERALTIQANPILLQIALDNIIGNAFKFSDHKQVVCRLKFVGKDVMILITDQGPGIHIEKLDQIFKPFYSSSTKVEHAGKGMGLYMAHKIVTLFGGEIIVKSTNESGTTFLIHFASF